MAERETARRPENKSTHGSENDQVSRVNAAGLNLREAQQKFKEAGRNLDEAKVMLLEVHMDEFISFFSGIGIKLTRPEVRIARKNEEDALTENEEEREEAGYDEEAIAIDPDYIYDSGLAIVTDKNYDPDYYAALATEIMKAHAVTEGWTSNGWIVDDTINELFDSKEPELFEGIDRLEESQKESGRVFETTTREAAKLFLDAVYKNRSVEDGEERARKILTRVIWADSIDERALERTARRFRAFYADLKTNKLAKPLTSEEEQIPTTEELFAATIFLIKDADVKKTLDFFLSSPSKMLREIQSFLNESSGGEASKDDKVLKKFEKLYDIDQLVYEEAERKFANYSRGCLDREARSA